VLTPNVEASTATVAGVEITGILVRSANSADNPPAKARRTVGRRLHISKLARRASLGGSDVKLTPRSFNLLVMLAEAARQGAAPVPLRKLEDELLKGKFEDKSLAKAVCRLKTELIRDGVAQPDVNAMIENTRAVGYRLTILDTEIEIED